MTMFFRVLDSSVDDKASALRTAVAARHSSVVFEQTPETFSAIPGSPFAYWVPKDVLSVFHSNPRYANEVRTALVGVQTSDDFRLFRLWWEPDTKGADFHRTWFPAPKGGRRAPFYADIPLLLRYDNVGIAVIQQIGRYGRGATHYFRPGFSWPLRGIRFSAFAVPRGCIFTVGGKMAFAPEPELLPLLALFNSKAFDLLIAVRAGKVGGVQYEAGLIQDTPVPILSTLDATRLTDLVRRAWSLKRSLDSTHENSHAFLLPPGVNERVTKLDPAAVERELAHIQHEIDDVTFTLYGIENRAAIEAPINPTTSDVDNGESDDADEADEEAVMAGGSDAVKSYLVGVAFGRFDPRLATGERPTPPEPEPFDPLLPRSPGMYPESEEPAKRPDILVDDEGHPDDLTARAISIAERVRVDVPENLRAWFAREFFPLHIKMYSKSHRKAPIYWQLATPSARYSVWLCIHAFSKDTLFRVHNDYVAPKLSHEERRLESLKSELRDGATAAQRKAVSAQETLLDELRAFLDEVKRLAPLWNPNLDDGVIINFAPLWRLVPQNKAWQKELKSCWDALCEGKYDWAHLAMHLWPERVVPKCAKDRSLAVAHGLEDMFWVEGDDGKRTARETPSKSVEDLVKKRASTAVKSALKSLLEAPVASGKSTGRARGTGRRRGGATEGDA